MEPDHPPALTVPERHRDSAETAPLLSRGTLLRLEADLAFASHPYAGVLAVTARDQSLCEHLLTQHGFTYDTRHRAFGLPPDVDRAEAAQRVAAITVSARRAGLHVLADPAVFVTDNAPEAGRRPLCYPSLDELTEELHHIDRAGDLGEVLDLAVSGHGAVFARFQNLLESAAAWCERLGTDLGLRNADHLQQAADRLAIVGRTVLDTADEMANSTDITSRFAPPLQRWPHRPVHPSPWPDPNLPVPAAVTQPPSASAPTATAPSAAPPAPRPRR
jgi:hypothetical protein